MADVIAVKQDIKLKQGSTRNFNALFRNKDTQVGKDISDYTPTLRVRDGYTEDAGNVEFILTDGDGIDTSEANVGRLKIEINATRTGALSYQKAYNYDLEIASGGVVTTLLYGKMTLIPDA